MVKRRKKYLIGRLTADDLDQDYMPGRSAETMSPQHKAALDKMTEDMRRRLHGVHKGASDDKIVIVLEPEGD